ncbi:nitrogen fixation protein NifQ [Cupriavidus oxalaticus]|jgi:nitrogen fixation protein NifQ|uniref:Nitrogen fixation protein NifQ n=1 Tax=Cupriavidus oxalaticus TaxID=96344 RepID=A0A375FKJ2_9BURK|nr:nitrogen fixation protein NifQ [Cupriavidus oxalaticus]QRQ84230.1 nitrogen fixation protein NifQ [Cupriavidus oxalaticus]QRQ91683.1 nitrogen fixation protein NifQ [Cupriavidus oxalaticus]WQD86266.1 nitrogen fixation protein NifQ [Cupriavidus oxalaticus]SPC05186.1 Nitrogen fixation protein NifQ [Cupriavidus oxalaticus]SPC18005.1 Nitrogen fixation protein NifQ [Cupriavidus oxalaticus]
MNCSLLLLDAFAAHPGDPVSRALSGVLESAGAGCLPRFAQWLGLPPDEFRQMLDTCFPGAAAAGWAPDVPAADPGALPCEFGDLVEMLWSGRSAGHDSQLVRWAAHALACGCFGRTHLWQDMGLSGREDVSGLLRAMFEPVFLANTTDMKWKKFFYHRVCERLDLHPCPEPSCSGCDQFANCHGPEPGLDQAQAVPILPSAKRP